MNQLDDIIEKMARAIYCDRAGTSATDPHVACVFAITADAEGQDREWFEILEDYRRIARAALAAAIGPLGEVFAGASAHRLRSGIMHADDVRALAAEIEKDLGDA